MKLYLASGPSTAILYVGTLMSMVHYVGGYMLLTETELNSLPPLYSQENEEDPVIHIKLEAPDRHWACYIAEGGPKDPGYEVFALFVGKYGYNWGQLPLTLIEEDLREAGINDVTHHSFTSMRSSELTGLKRRNVPL